MDIKGLKERITSGLLVWLLVTIFIQPILSFAWKAILVVGGFVHQGYVDRIYRNAAIIDSNPYGRTTLLSVLTIPVLVYLLWIVRRVEFHPDYARFPRHMKAMVPIGWTIASLLIALMLGKTAILVGTTEIGSSFTQRLTVLAPAISDTEYKTLKARWASMQGKSDYDALVATMDKRAAELGVKLPPVQKP